MVKNPYYSAYPVQSAANPYFHQEVTRSILGFAIEVHRKLGPGLSESAYEECLCWEFNHTGTRFVRQQPLSVTYKSHQIECAHRLDLLVEDAVLVEIKAVERLLPIHEAQLLSYLKLSGIRVGLLINFNVQLLKNGVRRLFL